MLKFVTRDYFTKKSYPLRVTNTKGLIITMYEQYKTFPLEEPEEITFPKKSVVCALFIILYGCYLVGAYGYDRYSYVGTEAAFFVILLGSLLLVLDILHYKYPYFIRSKWGFLAIPPIIFYAHVVIHLIGGYNTYRDAQTLTVYGQIGEGVVVKRRMRIVFAGEHSISFDPKELDEVVYQYTVEGKVYTQADFTLGNSYKKGEKLAVEYAYVNPQISRVADASKQNNTLSSSEN